MTLKASSISVVNQSAHLTKIEGINMAAAVSLQLKRDARPVWGPMPSVVAVAKTLVGSIRCTISDTPDIPDAGGYHDEDENGPYIKVFNLDRGARGTDLTLSHECLELALDAPANRWADNGHGSDVAFELCDAVEGDIYEIDGVQVSNFVLPAWFDPQASSGARFDRLGLLKAPFTMTPQGYMILRTEPGKVSQVFARHAIMHPGCDVREVPDTNMHLVFGKDYPEHKKRAKIIKAARRRGKNVKP